MLETLQPKLRARVKRRLQKEYFAWLTTVGSNLAPQPRPIWFIWQDDSFLIYSQPDAHKVQHIARHARVAVHFNADEMGENEILVFIGTASIDPQAPPAHKVPAYLRKYRKGIADLQTTPEQMAGEYSVAIRVKPTSVRTG